jgi:hypothetical protein
MNRMNPIKPPLDDYGPGAVRAIHALYCRWTGQNLSLRFDRERLWSDFLRAGFTPDELHRVILWLQKEISHQRRNLGALKLSNLLQLDRFEEDLNISRARLRPVPLTSSTAPAPPQPPPTTETQRAQLTRQLHTLRQQLRGPTIPPPDPNPQPPSAPQSDSLPLFPAD